MITARSAFHFSRPLHGLRPGLLPIPAMNRWAIFNRPLTRTQGPLLFVQRRARRAGASPPSSPARLLSCVMKIRLKGFHARARKDLQEAQGLEGGLPPQRGCPAGDPGLAPAVFVQRSTSSPILPVNISQIIL